MKRGPASSSLPPCRSTNRQVQQRNRLRLLFGALGAFEVGTTTAELLGAILVTGVLGGTFAPAAIAIVRKAELRGLKKASC